MAVIHNLTTGETTVVSDPTPTLEEARTAKLASIAAKRDAILTAGYTVESGPMIGEVLQTRDVDDRLNWLVSQASYAAAVGAGQGAVEGAEFRTLDNEIYVLSYANGLNVLLAMAAWGAAVMRNSWELKDLALLAEDTDDLDEVDIEQGWPE